ncbi:MAG: HigA family addiction module antitoxin [Bauldia sp.]|nr:HigA family addiction module antitoxin [Bauldia sp.]
MRELKIAPAEPARQVKVPPNRLSQIINGKRATTGDTALRLGHWFGTSAQFWINLQAACDLEVAESEVGKFVSTLSRRPAA